MRTEPARASEERLREFSRPLAAAPESGNLTDDVVRHASLQPDRTLFSVRVGSDWVDVTADHFHQQVRAVAKGLVAAGLRPGDRVCLLSRTRFEWTLFDYAIWFAGGVTVPVYVTTPADDVAYVLADSGARIIIVEDSEHRERLEKGENPVHSVEHTWVIDDSAVEALTALGCTVSDSALEAHRTAAGPGSVATLIYTSGTTGRPRGCTLTHGNFMAEVSSALVDLSELFDQEDACTLLFLPLAHVLARVVQVGCVRAGVRLAHLSDTRGLSEALESFRPTFVLGVPRVFEKVFNNFSQRALADGRRSTFDRAAQTAIAYSRAQDESPPGVFLRTRHALYERLVYAGLREAWGGRCRYAVSGGAPLGETLAHFYRGIGLPVLEGYGLTETTGAVTVNRPDATRIGTVGQPMSGVTLRIGEDGELLVSGGPVMARYWQDDQATSEVLTGDGWLRTGDLAEIDDEGYLRIVGRMKEIIVTAGGKNVAPSALEDRIRTHPLVGHCLVIGDGRPFIAALITLDADAVAVWARQNKKPARLKSLAEDADLRREIQSAVDEANKTVSHAEAVRRFAILPGNWTEEGGQLTPSLKVKRSVVLREVRGEVERLYRA